MAKRKPRGRALLGWAALFVLSAVLATQARAEDPKVLAKTKLVEGGELLKQGEYTEALARFKEAYDLVPSPKIFYNFGLAYSNLGRTTEAVEAFEKFLDEAIDANPEARANAERHKSEMVPKIASVVVRCDAEGADISVDGRTYGATPRKNPIRLDPGPHSLVVEKAPLPAFTQKLNVQAGQRVVVDVKLGVPGSPAPVAIAPPPPALPIGPAAPPEPVVPADATPPWGWKRKAALGAGIPAVAALAFGIVEQFAASSRYKTFNNYAAPNPLGKCDADARVLPDKGGGKCASYLSDADSVAVLAKFGFIAGGVLAASSITLFVLSNREQRESPAIASLGCVPTGQGVSCAFRF